MTVIETTLATEPAETRKAGRLAEALTRYLCAVLPAANPDFEDSYDSVRRWWVEVDEDGVPQRELGFDEAGKPIVAGPFDENFGFWTDSNMKFPPDEHKRISADSFEAAWKTFEQP